MDEPFNVLRNDAVSVHSALSKLNRDQTFGESQGWDENSVALIKRLELCPNLPLLPRARGAKKPNQKPWVATLNRNEVMTETKENTESTENTETIKTTGSLGFTRYLGFRHRVKVRIVNGEPTEPLPSTVAIVNADGSYCGKLELPSEQAELDLINGTLPTEHRVPASDEDISGFKSWQVIWRAVKDEDALVTRHESQSRFKTKRGKKGEPSTRELVEVVKEVPCEWTGLKARDALAMSLGGSGDYFAFAASNKLHSMDGEVFRIPPFKLRGHRGNEPKENDAKLLAELAHMHGEDFYPTVVRDKSIILVRETFKLRTDAMKDRMACAQRLRQRLIGMMFCSTTGGFPDGDIEKRFEKLKANDPIFTAIEAQEAKAFKAMTKAVEGTDVWQKLFADLPGVGPAIAARIISAIIDIRRFETDAKLKKFMGVHLIPQAVEEGSPDSTPRWIFPRRRNNEVANWNPDARQALYLLADQFVKKPGSVWGMKLNWYKRKFREKHPEVCVQVTQAVASKLGIETEKFVCIPIGPAPQKVKTKYTAKNPVTGEDITISGPQRYGDGHIHKMAIWRTLTKFVEWLHREWWNLEKSAQKASKASSADGAQTVKPA